MQASLFNWRSLLYRAYEERLSGRNTLRYADFLLQNQWESAEEIREFQWRELLRLIQHAYATVPFYRERFTACGLTPEAIRSPEDYARLPLLEKRDFNVHREALISTTADRSGLFMNGSGGSTGEPMRYYHDRDSYEWRQAAHLRGNMWAGSGLGRKELHLWGEPLKQMGPAARAKRSLHHWLLNHRYANSYRLTPESMDRYAREMERFRPDVLIGYSHSLLLLARHLERRGLRVPPPRGIIGTAEKLLPENRAVIERVFRAPVYDRYGCREVMLIAMECEEHHGLHLTADNLYVEILVDGRPARPGEVGEVVVTDLHNYAMPFLRYRNGDLAVASDRRCPCGRGLPLIEEVRGRTLDLLRTPEGRHISGVFVPMFFKDHDWVEEFQLEQTALDLIHVRLKPNAGYSAERFAALRSALQERIGTSVRLQYELLDEMPRTATGKHRPVISRLPEEGADVLAAA